MERATKYNNVVYSLRIKRDERRKGERKKWKREVDRFLDAASIRRRLKHVSLGRVQVISSTELNSLFFLSAVSHSLLFCFWARHWRTHTPKKCNLRGKREREGAHSGPVDSIPAYMHVNMCSHSFLLSLPFSSSSEWEFLLPLWCACVCAEYMLYSCLPALTSLSWC